MRKLDKLVVRGFQLVASMLEVPPRPEKQMSVSVLDTTLRTSTHVRLSFLG